MKFLINVSKQNGTSFYDGKHNPTHYFYCRIELDAHFKDDAIEQAKDISKRFPKSEGFKVELTYLESFKKYIEINEES